MRRIIATEAHRWLISDCNGNQAAPYRQRQPRMRAPCRQKRPRTPTPHTGKSSQERSALCSQIATARERKEFHAMPEQKRQAIPYDADAETLIDSAGHWSWAPTSPCSNDMQARQFHASSQNRTSRRQLYASSQNRTSGRQPFSSRGDGKERHAVKPSSIEQFFSSWGRIFSPRGQSSRRRDGSS